MSDDGSLALLAMGPAGAIGLYWMIYRYYRNTDKSHAFERETDVQAKPITGADGDHKIDEIKGTRAARIAGDNVKNFRQRVERVGDDSS
ncbi:MAG: hypothetical protein KDI69_00125 [Xanthomonadales bacterium]|jgi:hypothetical protein|nr:hypothetical protein [Xanthomonadales bacterium]